MVSGKSNEVFETTVESSSIIIGSSGGRVSSTGDLPTMANATVTSAATNILNTGKPMQVSSATPKHSTPLVTTDTITTTNISNCKRNPIIHGYQYFDSKKPIKKCNCSSTAQNKKTTNLNANSCDLNHCIVPLADPCSEIDRSDDGARIRKLSPKPLLSSLLGPPNTNSSNNATPTSGSANGSIDPIISLSKSETNIAESNIKDNHNQLSIYNVVSLNNLHDESFFNRTLNDISKAQCLTNSDENDLYEINPKTLSSPKVLTTVTVSMRNAADVSDKVF